MSAALKARLRGCMMPFAAHICMPHLHHIKPDIEAAEHEAASKFRIGLIRCKSRQAMLLAAAC